MRRVLPVHASTIRLFLHVLAAMVWVGGQIVLAALVPAVRRAGGADSLRAVARRFQFVAWPAFVALVATGIWNLMEVDVGDRSSAYLTTFRYKGDRIEVDGIATNAAELISQLEHSAQFKDVEFTAPTTKYLQNQERFSLRMGLEQ